MAHRQPLTLQLDYSGGFLKAARSGNLDQLLEYLKLNIDVNVCNANGLTALHLAAKEGHDHVVSELVRRRVNVESASRKGNTALHIAALGGHEAVVRILVENGANVNVKSQDGFTPLYMAAQENHVEVVKYLLDHGADHTIITQDGYTPLAVALQLGHDEVVGVLMDQDIIMQTKTKLPALHRAAKKDDVQAALLLLQKDRDGSAKAGGGVVNEITKSGFTPLHIASHYGNSRVGCLLIENGADINFKARNLVTPLHVASKWGRTSMVQVLVDSGADIHCLTKDGLTPLHCAARSGHDNVAKLLLLRGAGVTAKTKSRLSPLHMSAQGDHVSCAELFLNCKAPVDDVTIDYLTPLHVTAHCGSVKTCKLLLEKGCEVNARALNGFTPLHIACKKNRIKIIELLLRYGAAIDSTTETGLTPLHVAAFMGHMSIVKLLLELGANPNSTNERGETALHLAARGDQTEVMAFLLDNGAQVDAKAKELQTALHIAARQGSVPAVNLLLKRGASPNAATKDLYTPLHIAVREGHIDIAKLLLDHDASPSLTTKKGFTPLHLAAKHDQLKLAQVLLQRGVHPDIKGRNDLTPLHVGTHYGNIGITNYLLNKNANPVSTTKNGYTPLHIAAKKDHTDIASTLLERGAKPHCESRNGFTPLHLAVKEGHVQMVKLLFGRGADANCRAKNGLTPMHLAAQEDHVPVAEILVKNKAQIDPQTKAGYTPLHTACHFGQINMIQFLLEQGAAVNATTKLGFTPLHQAAQQGHVMVINLLLRYRANPNAVNAAGQTPLSIAQRLGYLSVVETLNQITEVIVSPSALVGRYKHVTPETMQEATLFEMEETRVVRRRPGAKGSSSSARRSFQPEDGEEESFRNGTAIGADSLPPGAFRYLTADDGHTGSGSPSFRDESDIFGFDKTPDRWGSMSFDYHALEDEMKYMREPLPSAMDEITGQYTGTMPMALAQQSKSRAPPPEQLEGNPLQFARQPESKTLTLTSRKRPAEDDVSDSREKPPDFLVSFLVDARGGLMEGSRPAGVRLIIPPGSVTKPTRITCRLIRVEKLANPPLQMEGEALATRILEMGPSGTKFNRPILIDVPHFASLRGREREILVLRCDDGQTWQEHVAAPGVDESDLLAVVKATFEDVEPSHELYKKRVSRILASDLPQYFALVTRITKEKDEIDSRGGAILSANSPKVKVVVPSGAVTKSTKMGLQVQPIPEDIVTKRLSGRETALSPIVTINPRRRKFNKPLTVTMPLPKKGFTHHAYGNAPTLRLLRNITDGSVPAQWEDVTDSTPLTVMEDTATFSTPSSASFWLVDTPNVGDSVRIASELYQEIILVPFVAKFVICGRRHLPTEAKLRIFCMTGDVLEKTIRHQGKFAELARSREVEVLNKTPQYLEMEGNLAIVEKSGKQPSVFFRALKANGVPIVIRMCEEKQDPTGRLSFMRDPKYPKGRPLQIPICTMNVMLPHDVIPDTPGDLEDEDFENRRLGDLDGYQGYSDSSSLGSSVPMSDQELSPEEKAALHKKFEENASDLESEPDYSLNDQNGRIKKQDPSIPEIVLPAIPVKIDLIQEENAYSSFAKPTNYGPRILTKPELKREPAVFESTFTIPLKAAKKEPVITHKTIDGGTRLVKDAKDKQYKNHDGSTVKERVATTKHVKTITEVTLTDGIPSDSQTKEELLLTEIEENIVELPPGVTSLLNTNIQTETSEKLIESTLPDGSLVKKKIIRTVGRLKPAVVPRESKPEAKVAVPKVTHEVMEGELIPRSKTEESQKTRDDGVTEKLKIVTTQYFKPITEITFTDGLETDRKCREELDNTNIEENILELPSGVIEPNANNCDTDISIQTSEFVMPDGSPAKKRTVRMIVHLKKVPEKQISVQRTEGDIRSTSQVLEDQENLDSGRKTRKRKLITTKHFKPVTEVTVVDGVALDPVMHEEFLGAEVDENILELSAGVIEPYAANCDTTISLENSELPLEEGVVAKKALVTMSVTPKAEKPDTGTSIVEGPITSRAETRQSEGKLNNGGSVRRKIVTTTFLNPIREVTTGDGPPKTRLIREEVVGVEVVENVLELPPGVTEPNGKNITTKTILTKSEETLPNGKLAKKKVIKTIAEVGDEHVAQIEQKPVPAKRKTVPTKPKEDITSDDIIHRIVEGEIESKVDVVEDEEKLDAGVIRKRKIVTTRYCKPTFEITIANGMPPEFHKREEIVDAEIKENILELDYGVVASNAANCDADILVTQSRTLLPEGVPAKKKTTKITVKLPQDGKKEADAQAKAREARPKESRKLTEGDIERRSTEAEDKQGLSDGGTIKRKIITTKHIKPITEIISKEGKPSQENHWEELVATDIEENILQLPAGVIEPNSSNCDIDVSVDETQVTLPDGNLANKTVTKMVVTLRDPSKPPKEKRRKRKPGIKGKLDAESEDRDIIEGPVESRTEVKEFEVKRTEGNLIYKVVTITNIRSILKVSKVGGMEMKTKLREELVSKEIIENLLELPQGVTDIHRRDVKLDTTVTSSEETLPEGVPVKKTHIRTTASLLRKEELSQIPEESGHVPDVIHKVIEGEIAPRTETEEDEQNLNDGTTVAKKIITTRYVKPITEVKLVRGHPPESTTKEEILNANVSENILELPCGIIEPYGENCEADISVADSKITLPEKIPAKKKTTKMTVTIKPPAGKSVPMITKKLVEGEIESKSSVSEEKEKLKDGGTIWQNITTTKHVKPITEVTCMNGIPTHTKRWEELVGTDIEENLLQLPAGVIEPKASNCDIDVSVEKSQVTLPDGSSANKTVIKTIVTLRDPKKPLRGKLQKRKWKPGRKVSPKDKPELDEDIIEGPIESRSEVEDYETKASHGGLLKYHVVTTTYVKTIMKISKLGGMERRTKLREELDSKEIVENILELPPGVTDVNRRDVKTDTTVTSSSETLPEGVPVTKKVVKTTATLLGKNEIPDFIGEADKIPDVIYKSIEGEIEPRIEYEEDEQTLDDGTTVRQNKTTTRYVKPITEVKLVKGSPPESTTKEVVLNAEVSENILELPCGIIEPHGDNCETKVSVTESDVTLPDNIPAKAKTTRMVVTLKPPSGEKIPKVTKKLIEGDVESKSSVTEDKEDLYDGGIIWRKVTTTKHIKPVTEVTCSDGIPIQTKRWEELVGTDIEENLLQLPVGVIEPNSSNCDIDVTADKSQVTLPDENLANKTLIKTIVSLRDPFKPPREKGKKKKYKSGKKIAHKGDIGNVPRDQQDIIEGPIESRTEVKDYEVKANDGGLVKYRVVTTSNVKTILKVSKVGGVERRTKLREELDSKEIVENILELPPGVTNVNRRDIKTETTVSSSEETLPEGVPVTKKVVRTTATLLGKSELLDIHEEMGEIPKVVFKVVEGEIEPRTEIEEDEQNLPDGTTIKQSVITTKYVKPTTEVKLTSGLPPESTTKVEVLKADISENILELPCGVIEPHGENCETDVSSKDSKITLPDNIPANKKTTRTTVTLKPSGEGEGKIPKITKKLLEGDIISRLVMAEEKEDHDDGSTVLRKTVTVKHFKPFTDTVSQDGVPVSTVHWEELVGTDIEENVLQLPAGVIEPNSTNCDIDVSVDKSEVMLPDGSLANKTLIATVVKLRDLSMPPRAKRQKCKRKSRGKAFAKGKDLPELTDTDIIEGPLESRTEVKEYEVKGKDGGLLKYRVVTTTYVRTILKLSKVGGIERKTKLREELDSKEIVENILELPPGVTDVNSRGVKTDTTVTDSEETLPEGVPVMKRVIKTVASILSHQELTGIQEEPGKAPSKATHKVIEGEIQPRIEVEEEEQNQNDGTTITKTVVTTRYVKPITEVKLVSGFPPESNTREEIQSAEVSESILELPCGVIDPFANNCDRDITVHDSEVTLPEGTLAKKRTTKMVVQLRPSLAIPKEEEHIVPITFAKRRGVPKVTTKVLEGDVGSRSETDESQRSLEDGSTVTHRVVTTTYFKPVTEIISVDGIPTEEKHREEHIGTDIDENIVQLPAGVVEPNASNCDIDVLVDKSQVPLPDGILANKTVTKMIVMLRDAKKPPRERLRKRKWKPGRRVDAAKGKVGRKPEAEQEDVIEGSVESRTEVKEYEVNEKDGRLVKYRIVTTINVKSILKLSKIGGKERRTKLREVLDSKDVVENILELPPGVTDVNRSDVKTDTTVTCSEETLPEGVPVTKKIVRTTASLMAKPDITAYEEPSDIPSVVLKVIEGKIEPKREMEEDEKNLDDGRTVRRMVVTTKYVKPVTEVRLVNDGPPESTTREEIVDAEVIESILDLPCGVIGPHESNCHKDISVQKSEVVLPEGIPAWKKITMVVIQLQPPESVTVDATAKRTEKPSEVTRKILEGEVQSKSVVVEDQEALDDGGTVKRKIITTSHVKPITEIIVQDGVPLETKHREELIGTEIEENILKLPSGVIEPNAANCVTDLSVDSFEVLLKDGSLARKALVMMVVKLKDDLQDAMGRRVFPASDAKKSQSLTDLEVSENILEGPVQSRTESKHFKETSDMGCILLHNTVTTTFFKPVLQVTTENGIEKRILLRERTVNIEVVENILELPPGITELDSRNTESETSVNVTEESLPDGVPLTKRVVTTVATLLKKALAADSEKPDIIHRVIEGEIKPKSEVVEFQHNLEDGTAIKRKVTTTRLVKPVTEVKLTKGHPPESKTREETVASDVKEHVLELQCGTIEPNAKNCDIDISVDKVEDVTPENVPSKKKTTKMTVKLRPPVGEMFPQVSRRTVEGEIEARSAVQEFNENLDDGATAKHKIITTKYIKPITEIISSDGLTIETKDWEELVKMEIEENILQLPVGVIEPNAINCDAEISVNTADIALPDGSLARKTITKIIVQLKEPSLLAEDASQLMTGKLLPTKPGEEKRIIDGEVTTITDTKEDEDKTTDGATVKSKVVTMTHSKPSILVTTVDGKETKTVLREQVIGVDIVESILKLSPGVTDPNEEGVKTETSVKKFHETLPDGVPVNKEVIETKASLARKTPKTEKEPKLWPEDISEAPDVTQRILEGPIEAKSEVKEDQKNLDDGRTIKQKEVTTRYVKPVTEVILVDGCTPEVKTKEELVNGDVKQIVLDLPCGRIEPFAANCDTDISVENTSTLLPENLSVPKKVIKMIVHLIEPTSVEGTLAGQDILQGIGKPRISHQVVEGKLVPKSISKEDEHTLNDGTVVRQKVITTQYFKPITEITLVDDVQTESRTRDELVDTIIDETLLQLSPGVIEPDASNCESDISFDNSQVTLPDGTLAKKRLVRIVVRIKEAETESEPTKIKIIEGPVELRPKLFKDEKKLGDGSTVRRKVTTTRHIKPILEVVFVNGIETGTHLREEKLVLTEIEENILQLPPGIKDVSGNNVQTKTTVKDFEDTSDGSPIKRKVIRTVATVGEEPKPGTAGLVKGPPTTQVIEGPIQSRTTVTEDQKNLDEGVIRKEKIVTTVHFRPITEVILSEGSAPDSQVREVIIKTVIDECILELPAGVIMPFAENCNTEIKVDNFEYSLPDGSPVTKKVVQMIVTLKKEFQPALGSTEAIRMGRKPETQTTKLVEGEVEPRTKVAEEQKNLPNGVTLKRKLITTTFVKPVTEIVFVDGKESERRSRGVTVGVDKEEHILELPCGVVEPYASNCDTDISVTNSQEELPDGIVANKKVVKITVQLKPDYERLEKPKVAGKRVIEGPVQPHVRVEQRQETKDDGTRVKSKVTTTKNIKTVTETAVVDGVEMESETKEVLVSTEIVADVLELLPSVTEPYDNKTTESIVTVKHSDEISPDGLPVMKTVTTTTVSPKSLVSPTRVTTAKEVTHKTVKGEVRSQTTATEDRKDLDDGSSIRRKVITTIYIMPVTELTLVNGKETEVRVREEIVRADIEEHLLQLPAGLIEPHANNCDIEISIQNFDDNLPDGTPAKKKVVSTVVRLKAFEGQMLESQRTIEGEIRTVKDVKDDEEVTVDGRTIRTRTITTKWLKPVTEVALVNGIEVKSKTRDVVVATEIDENILELPPNVKDENRSDLESRTSVEQDEVALPDGTVAKRKTTRTVVTEPEKTSLVKHTLLEGPVESRKTETQDQQNTDDGKTIRRKVITTKHVKPVTDITLVDGTPTESSTKEVLLGVDIEEHILQLPPGVIEPFGSNCDTDISVENSEEALPEGVVAKKKVVTMVVSLKPQEKEIEVFSPVRPTTFVEGQMPLSPEERMRVPSDSIFREHSVERTLEKPVEVRKKVTEDQKNLEDGGTLRRKVITTDYVKPIWKVRLIDEREKESFVRDEIVDTEIEEHILQLPPGVIEPFGSNCETDISVETSEVMLPDGRVAKKKIVKMIVFLKSSALPEKVVEQRVSVTEEKPAPAEKAVIGIPSVSHRLEEGPIASLVKVTESQQILEDGSTVRRKVITTKFIKPVTDITLVDGVETTSETREENIRTEIEEITLKLPAGVIEPYGSNLETDTTVDQFDDTLPDGTPAKKKLVTIVVHLKHPVQPEKRESLSEDKVKQADKYVSATTSSPSLSDAGSQVGRSPDLEDLEAKRRAKSTESMGVVNKVIEGVVTATTEVEEDENCLDDGTTIRRKVVTIRHFKPVTKLTITDGLVSDATMEEETVKTEIDENILQLPPGVTDPKGDNLQTDTTVRTFQETLPDGRVASRKVTKKIITMKRPPRRPQKDTALEARHLETGADFSDSKTSRDVSMDSKTLEMTSVDHRIVVPRAPTDSVRSPETGTVFKPIIDDGSRKPQTERIIQREQRDRPKINLSDDSDSDRQKKRPPSKRSPKEKQAPTKLLTVRKPVVTKRVRTKIRRVGPDGEIFEDVFTDEEDLSDVTSPTSIIADFHDLGSPTLVSPGDSDVDNPAIKVYTDTVESEPVIERQVQEFEDTLPDGTLVKRRLIKTTQKKTIIKRVVMEGPEDELASASEEQVRQMLPHRPSSTEPQLTKYTDVTKQEPQTETDLKEYEETLPDGTVVKKRVKTTTQQKLTTERTVLGGTLDDNALREIFKDGGSAKALPADEDDAKPDKSKASRRSHGEERSSRLMLRKQVHKRTVIEPGREETVIMDETHLDRNNEEPEELRDSIRDVIRELIGSSSSGDESM